MRATERPVTAFRGAHRRVLRDGGVDVTSREQRERGIGPTILSAVITAEASPPTLIHTLTETVTWRTAKQITTVRRLTLQDGELTATLQQPTSNNLHPGAQRMQTVESIQGIFDRILGDL